MQIVSILFQSNSSCSSRPAVKETDVERERGHRNLHTLCHSRLSGKKKLSSEASFQDAQMCAPSNAGTHSPPFASSRVSFITTDGFTRLLGISLPIPPAKGGASRTKPLKNHYFFGIRLDIRSMPAIVSINIYTYHVNQNSPVPRGHGISRGIL